MKPYVLVATPHNRLEKETIQSLFVQTYTGHVDHHFTSRNENPVPGQNIIAAYRRLQRVFLADPAYTHLWIVENDLIVPPNALERLLAIGADLAYGTYCFRRGTPVVNVMHRDTTDPLTGYPDLWHAAWGQVVDCAGLGFGCTLIARHVLERFEMRSEFGGGDADTCLARDAKKAGLVQKADLGLACGHIRPDGVVLWPQRARPFYRKRRTETARPRLAEIRALIALGVWDEHGVPHILRPADTLAVDYEIAATMVATGQAEYVSGLKDVGA